jgi:hypothetical protein
MSSLTILGDTSGSVLIQAPAVAGSPTLTLPTTSGTVALSGPAFYAYAASNQTGISSGSWTKVTLGSESLDSNNNFASSRFTPTVAGWYFFNASIYCATSTNMTNARLSFYLNGNQVLTGPIFYNASTDQIVNGSGMYYMNGTGDYMELYGIINGGSGGTFAGSGGSIYTFFQGFFVRQP